MPKHGRITAIPPTFRGYRRKWLRGDVLAAGDPTRYAALAAALALVVGLPCLVARAVRLGFLADLLSRSVLLGYPAGVAFVILVLPPSPSPNSSRR